MQRNDTQTFPGIQQQQAARNEPLFSFRIRIIAHRAGQQDAEGRERGVGVTLVRLGTITDRFGDGLGSSIDADPFLMLTPTTLRRSLPYPGLRDVGLDPDIPARSISSNIRLRVSSDVLG